MAYERARWVVRGRLDGMQSGLDAPTTFPLSRSCLTLLDSYIKSLAGIVHSIDEMRSRVNLESGHSEYYGLGFFRDISKLDFLYRPRFSVYY